MPATPGSGSPVPSQPDSDWASHPLMELVYDELRTLASSYLRRESPAHTLQTTELVHEAWLRLAGRQGEGFTSRGHFFCAAALAMRRILVDHAERKGALKRGGKVVVADFDAALEVPDTPRSAEAILALHGVLESLASQDPRKAKVVELKFFGGFSIEETAEALNVGTATVEREWRFAKAWLRQALEGDGAGGSPTPAP